MKREEFINQAKSWLGTPFKENAQLKYIGCDCAGLLIGLASECGFGEFNRNIENLETAFKENLVERAFSETPKIGDILLFNANSYSNAQHTAILIENNQIIHAHWRAGVVRNTFGNWFKARHVKSFYFSQIQD